MIARDTHRPHRIAQGLLTALLLVLGLGLRAGAAPPPHTSAAEAFAIGVDAYLYGYPLVLMGTTERVATNVATPDTSKGRAPVNQFLKGTLPSADYTDVVLPSTSTLYCSAWLDLSKGPLILHLPDFGGRFFLMQLLDAWTNDGNSDNPPLPNGASFTALGTRYGTGEGYYALVGPGWNGTFPPNVAPYIKQVVQFPTNLAWIIGRILTSATPDDVASIQNTLYPQISLTPQSKFPPPYNPPPARVDPTVPTTTPLQQVAAMDAPAFYGTLADLLMSNPPLPGDGPTVARLAKIGIVPGQPFRYNRLPGPVKAGLDLAVLAGAAIMSHSPQLSLGPTNWSMPLRLGSYGTQYVVRAFIAREALGANYYKDAIYGGARIDGAGNALNGANVYKLHFDANQLPPVSPKAFWSITVYNAPAENLVPDVPRHAIGYPDIEGAEPQLNPDGSLDIYVSAPSDPNHTQYLNWLPAPPGGFLLFLRMYMPGDAVLNGTWNPPAVENLSASAVASLRRPARTRRAARRAPRPAHGTTLALLPARPRS